jgi:hypothetical protein
MSALGRKLTSTASFPGKRPVVPLARDERIPEGTPMSSGYTPGVPRLGIPARSARGPAPRVSRRQCSDAAGQHDVRALRRKLKCIAIAARNENCSVSPSRFAYPG